MSWARVELRPSAFHGEEACCDEREAIDQRRSASLPVASSPFRWWTRDCACSTQRFPWREFRWYKGQRHFSGSYWSATMGAPVGYESRLEYANLLLVDFDPQVRWILSQPFLLEGDDRGTARRHVPDFLIAQADKSVCVIDVKPVEKLSQPKVRDSLDWSRRVIEAHGWGVPGSI